MKLNGMIHQFKTQSQNNNRPPEWLVKGDLNRDGNMDGNETARMKLLDGNKDGIIDKTEHQRELRLFDGNRDGRIDLQETQNQFNIGRNASCDFNGDGKVDSLEQNVLNKYDKNGDNLIGPLERLAQLKDWDKNKDGKIGPIERFMELFSLYKDSQEEDTETDTDTKLNMLA
ncbi:MAG: hypothetical protein AB1782_13765 [Cyanobacteriota bacterium]